MSFNGNDTYLFVMSMLALVVCITIHEFAHAYSAYRAGDDTPKAQGRISLNPLDHLDLMGTIMMVVSSMSGFGVGWGKPVIVNPLNFNRPRWDNLWVSLWGPLSNLLTALVTGTALRFLGTHMSYSVELFVYMITAISVGLAIFNLIPIAPLDGSHIVSSLLPYEKAKRYDYFMARFGIIIFLGLIFIGSGRGFNVLDMILGPPRDFLMHLFTGL
ncbi:MAG: site-2 protease family protein [Armatimonadota bacterium]|nr:site-2 protease family protein [bacterium]